MLVLLAELWIWAAFGFSWFIIASFNDRDGVAMIGSLLAIAGYVYFADKSIGLWFKENTPFPLILYAAGYFVVGTCWMFAKWYFYLLNRKDELRNDYKKWPKDNETVEEFIQRKWPSPSDKRDKIIGWIAYWPSSVIHALLFDVFRRVGHKIYYVFQSRLEAISRHVRGG